MMPLMDGWTVLESLKKAGGYFPRIIMLSARGPERDLDRAASLGVTHYLRKPFDPSELLKKVEEVLNE
jgi:DNA-binding response OmpR family regulator